MSGPGLEAAHGVNAARTRHRTLSARGNDGMRDGYLLLPRPGPCQRHDPFPIPARAGTHAIAWADARPCSSIGFRALVYATRGCGFESCQGHFGAVAQWQGVPSATGRSRVRTPPAPRHAACRRVQAQTFRETTSCQDGAPPEWNTQTAGRPARPPRRGCGAVAARLLPKQETAGSNPVIRSIRKTRTMDPIH